MRDLSFSEVEAVSGGIATSHGFVDSILGLVVDGLTGAFAGALTGGANAGAAGSGGLVGAGIIAQGIGAIAGCVLGGLSAAAYGFVVGWSNSDSYMNRTLDAIANGTMLPKTRI